MARETRRRGTRELEILEKYEITGSAVWIEMAL